MYIFAFIGLLVGLALYAYGMRAQSVAVNYCAYAVAAVSSFCLWFTIVTHQVSTNLIVNAINGITIALIALWVGALYFFKDKDLIVRALLITVAAWINSSLFSHPSIYITVFALYVVGLFIYGVHSKQFLYRIYSYGFFVVLLGYVAQKYLLTRWVHPHNAIQLTYVFGLLTLLLFTVRGLFHKKQENLTPFERNKVEPMLHLVITIGILAWIRALIIIRFDEPQIPGSFFMQRFGGYSKEDTILLRTNITDIILRLYYALFAAITLAVGIVKKERGFIYLSAFLFLLVLYKIWCLLIGIQSTVNETVAATILGIFIVGFAHIYQKVRKRVE